MPNDNIMGIKTKACVNGVYPDTIPTIQQDIANIEDDIDDINTELDNVVHKTGDEEISGEKTFTEDLTVHGNEVNTSGTVVLSPSSQGAIVQLKDNMNRPISIVHSHDSDGNCYLREYPDNYYPVDENENPVVPSNPTIMTSGLVAVDPRIVHITGNETIAGNKNFSSVLTAYQVNSNYGYLCQKVYVSIPAGKWVKIYAIDGNYSSRILIRVRASNHYQALTDKIGMYISSSVLSAQTDSIYFTFKLCRKGNAVEIWASNITSSAEPLNCDEEFSSNRWANASLGTVVDNPPVEGVDDYTQVVDSTAWGS